ncbi:MAG: TIGR02452 family protein [Paenibacillaceae bacterium]|nr:TIGR02452 family protein [Paenibacillaceae bacterium]
MKQSRKETAQETLQIQLQGFYKYEGRRIDFAEAQKHSEEGSRLISPEEGAALVRDLPTMSAEGPHAVCSVANESTVKAIMDHTEAGKDRVGVLNFASAKNAGGGFLNGAMAQEESLAASSGLYGTLLRHPAYYTVNRACRSMMYTDYAIYSPEVVFFRDDRYALLPRPVVASVLTLPAVNYGQVMQKGEDSGVAERVMKDRMRLALAIFANMEAKHLILGAYGCGVFRNDPMKVARWWRELLEDEHMGTLFMDVRFAVLDAKDGKCIRAFDNTFH